MKLYYIIGCFSLLLFANSCENHKAAYEAELLRQQLLQDSLSVLEEEERLIKGDYAETMETLSTIEEALRDIAANNKEIDLLIQKKNLSPEGEEQQQLIIAQLDALQASNKSSYQEAERLHQKIKAYKVENQQIKKMIANLETKLLQKEAELDEMRTTIGEMRNSLNSLEKEVSITTTKLAYTYINLKLRTNDLEETNKELSSTIKELQKKNKFIAEDAVGHFVCASRKVLRENNIINLLSMKRLTPKYRAAVQEIGQPLSIMDETQIDCGNGDIIYLLPERVEGSYKIEGSKLKILDKKMFWTTSKAVVLVKK